MDLKKLEVAAKAGQAGAQTLLGLCYLDGVGVAVNYSQAFQWLTMASENGAPRAQANLAVMYQQGLGINASFEEAERLFLQASQKQEFMAIIGLARLYAQHSQTPKACHWYQQVLNTADKRSHEDERSEAQSFLDHNQ